MVLAFLDHGQLYYEYDRETIEQDRVFRKNHPDQDLNNLVQIRSNGNIKRKIRMRAVRQIVFQGT